MKFQHFGPCTCELSNGRTQFNSEEGNIGEFVEESVIEANGLASDDWRGYQRPYIALLTETEYLDFSYKCKALIM
ncbi:unnamed protein product [Callosobruchus maculatus]|uniref:Uncharacterized protein n=1 Tax=Callosobruchus maculatus TaxID=64391 RepID=A0A653DPQ5_CALMS|nr:unnamed protein product [Callosobruchus maculatus]